MTSNDPSKRPPWLIPGLVQNVLRKSEKDESINVHAITSKAATVDGDNYMSDISRVHIEFTRGQTDHDGTEKKTLIFKVSPSKDAAARDVGQKLEVFETEIEMMQNTLVKMSEILHEKDYRFNARAFYSQLGDPSFLVLEDLAARGFLMADRKVGLDLDHCMLVMKGLAKFHASSVALYEKDPNCIKRYRRGLYHKDSPESIRLLFKETIKALSVEVENWPELDPSYSKKLLKISEIAYDEGVKCAEFRENEFNVINHGDDWINNLMFRYDNKGKVVDQIFLDFQLCVWTSPVYDLIYSLNSNTNDDIYIHHFDELIAEYSKVLTNTMLRINCKTKPPTLNAIRQSMEEREFLALLTSIVCLPFALVDESQVVNLSEFIESEGKTYSPGIKDTRFRRIITRRLKNWNSRGLLDI